MPKLASIHRYPVKGFAADPMDNVELTAGKLLPWDRAFAIENGGGHFDPANPVHMKKKFFLMMAANPAIAALPCRFDEGAMCFTVLFDSGEASIDLTRPETHAPLFDAVRGLLQDEIRGDLRLVHAPAQAITDIPQPHVSIINLASVRDLADKCGREIDPGRFRGNLLIDDCPAWSEFDWVGQEIRIGDAVLRVDARIGRCAATSVDLRTGTRDMDLPESLFKHYGHTQCGIYAEVVSGGRVEPGATVSPAS